MKLIIFGAGGHAGVVVEAVRKSLIWEIEGLLDETEKPTGSGPALYRHGQPVLDLQTVMANRGAFKFFVAIGDNTARERLIKTPGCSMINVFHPRSYQANTSLTEGSFFGAHSVVGNGAYVGRGCILNTGAILEHDSTLGDFSHLCPGVVTGGWVKIGSRTTVGLGAMIRDGITIGERCLIGMGAVVLEDVPDNSTVIGNPGRIHEPRRV